MDEIIGGQGREIIGELEIIGADDMDLDFLEDEIGAAEDDQLEALIAMVEGEEDDYYDEDEIGYDDVDELIGAIRRGSRRRRRRGRPRSRRAKLARMLRRASARGARAGRTTWAQSTRGGGVAVKRQAQPNARVILLGGTATQGAVAGQLLISTTAQELTRVDRLIVTGVDGGGVAIPNGLFSISDVKVGTKSQFASVQPVPGTIFQADTTGMGYSLGFDTIQPGTDFTVVIANAPALSTFTFGTMASAVR